MTIGDELKLIRDEFNKTKLKWAVAGSAAISIHAMYTTKKSRSPRNIDIMIHKDNRQVLVDKMIFLGYELIQTKTSRSNIRFERRGKTPVNLLLITGQFHPVVYEKIPVLSLQTLINMKKEQNKSSNNLHAMQNILNARRHWHSFMRNLIPNIN